MFPSIENRVVCLDVESTGLKWWLDKVFGFSITVEGQAPTYYDLRKTPAALMWLKEELPHVKLWVNHNVKFDAHMMISMGVKVNTDKLSCTMMRAALIDEHLLKYDLNSLGKKYLGIGKDTDIYAELAGVFGGRATRSAQVGNFPDAPVELMARYANQDVMTAFKLWEWQNTEIDKQNLGEVVDLEHRLLPAVIRMERSGIRIDTDRVERSAKEIDGILMAEQRDLDRMAGFAVNYNPSGSIKKLFEPKMVNGRWVLIDGTVAEPTDSGGPSIDAGCLRRMKHPAAAKILRLRKLHKTSNTFLKGHLLGHSHNGRVYCNINQTKNDEDAGTGTGRLSITDPALQQIPARDKEIKKIVRPCFLPDEGHDWVGLDWSQMDFRMMAHYTRVPSILERYDSDPRTDFHQVVADMTGIPRSPRFAGDANAKQINLGLCVSGDTEFLTERGWVRISDYSGEKIAVASLSSTDRRGATVTYENPIRYINSESIGQWYDIKNMRVTDGHRIPAFSYSSTKRSYKLQVLTPPEMESKWADRPYSIPQVWSEPDRLGMALTDDELRVAVAVQADGYFKWSTKSCVVGLKKTRKITRLKELLTKAGIDFRVNVWGKGEVTYVSFVAPIRSKSMGDEVWWAASAHQRAIILDELPNWDGSVIPHGSSYRVRYYSSDKASADFIQWCSSSIGLRSEIRQAPTCWHVDIGMPTVMNVKPRDVIRTEGPDRMYCFETSTGFWVARRNNRVFITGNCFGMGQGRLASEMGLPYTEERGRNGKVYLRPGAEAENIFNRYHAAVPGVKDFLDRAGAVAKSRGYVISVMGRHLRFPGGFSLHKAGGYLFQSACADAMKLKLIEFDKFCPEHGGRLLLTVHDELGLSMPRGRDNSDAQRLFTRFDGVETPLRFRVPIESDMWVEDSWYEP